MMVEQEWKSLELCIYQFLISPDVTAIYVGGKNNLAKKPFFGNLILLLCKT